MAKKKKRNTGKSTRTRKRPARTKPKKTTRRSKRMTVEEKLHTSAPKKLAPQKGEPGKVSTHKARASWFNAREAWPMREAPVDLLLSARADAVANVPMQPGGATWMQAGPTNVGGRMTSIVVDPNGVDRICVGAAGGGIWTSTDGGLTWMSRWHDEPTLNIGALCLDPADSDIIYCGTGEANLSADSHAGVGLYRSTDGGVSWHLLAPAVAHSLPRRIGRVAVDPFDSDHILLAGVGHRAEDPRGLFVSTDRGNSWARALAITPYPFQCHEVVFHPTTPGTVYVAIDAIGAMNGIWKSQDGGQSWAHLTSGLPSSSSIRRTSIAIAPSNPKVMYTQIASVRGAVLGIFRTGNGGSTWKDVSGSHFYQERQMNYNNTISVDPSDENVVICGGVDIHRSKNGGTTWKKLTRWNAERESPDYAHADQHMFCQPAGQSGLVYAMNDGGMDVSQDGGDSWENRSNGLATNMFYDLSVAATDGNMYGGGMQDNGTWLTLDGQADSFIETTGGDGGFCAIDPNDRLHLYTSSQFMFINRFRQSDGWRHNIGPNETGPKPWMAFLAIDPDRPKRVFVGSQRVWRTKNDGGNWKDVSGFLDDSFVTCIEISRANTDYLYVGTENGGIFKSEDGGETWTDNIASSGLPGRTITRLRTPADNANVVYATVANFGNSHLFRSTDGGGFWTDIDGGNLPDAPHHGIAIPSSNPDVIFVGGDAGVFVSSDAGGTWNNLTLNLPTVMVVDLVLHEATNALLAATYGRSTWRLDVSEIQ